MSKSNKYHLSYMHVYIYKHIWIHKYIYKCQMDAYRISSNKYRVSNKQRDQTKTQPLIRTAVQNGVVVRNLTIN